MVLVTTGTNEQSFDRLVEAAGTLTGDLLVQYGSSAITSGPHGQWIDFMPFEALRVAMLEAAVVVCHAGVGSVMLAQRCGKRPIVMPRRVAHGEAVDDHQVSFAYRLARIGAVTIVESGADLARAVAAQLDQPVVGPPQDVPAATAGGLAGELRAFLETRVAGDAA